MAETGTRINVPPSSSQVDVITIAGEKEGVASAKERIMKTYQSMVSIGFFFMKNEITSLIFFLI